MPTNLNETQLYEEYNQLTSFEICFQSQESIQELVNKASDLVVAIRNLTYLLIAQDHALFVQRKAKIEELLKVFELTVSRLRQAGYIIHQRKLALDNTDAHEDKKHQSDPAANPQPEQAQQASSSSTARLDELKLEKEQLIEQIRNKNGYIKLAIDKVSDIIWQINSIQTIRN